MRNLVGRATCLLVLTLTFLLLSCLSTPRAQVRLVDPSGRARAYNAKQVKEATAEINRLMQSYNDKLKQAQYWENVDPEKVLPEVNGIVQKWIEVQQLLNHYDEVDP